MCLEQVGLWNSKDIQLLKQVLYCYTTTMQLLQPWSYNQRGEYKPVGGQFVKLVSPLQTIDTQNGKQMFYYSPQLCSYSNTVWQQLRSLILLHCCGKIQHLFHNCVFLAEMKLSKYSFNMKLLVFDKSHPPIIIILMSNCNKKGVFSSQFSIETDSK